MSDLLTERSLAIVALHLPAPGLHRRSQDMSWLEAYLLQNLAVFAEAGFRAVILQDGTPTPAHAYPETIAVMSALGRLAHREFASIRLGIIINAHDPIAPLAIAYASGAEFVRIKAFVGAMLKAEGIQQGCGVEAYNYRSALERQDIKILADVHDRMGIPIENPPISAAAAWAVDTGADALVLTGLTVDDSLARIRAVRAAGITRPLIVGGSADEHNVATILREADGVVVSTALKRDNPAPEDLVQWDRDKCRRFIEAAKPS
jgi:membrane complex biogenesis BtpA family protein